MSLAYDRLHRSPSSKRERLHVRVQRDPQRHHHRFRANRVHRGGLRRTGGAAPPRLRGLGDRGWRPDEHHRGRELPRLPRRHHGSGADGRDARSGGALRRRAGARRRGRGRPHRRRQGRQDRHRHLHRACGDPRDGLRLPQARSPPGGGAVGPRRLLVRHLRRLLLPRPAHRGRGRRRLRRGGGHLPHPLRLQGQPDRAPRRAARLQDHAGARLRRPEAGDRLELPRRGDPRRRPARPIASSASKAKSGCPATASPGAPPATASSSARRTSRSSAAATRRWRRRPSSPASPRRST